MLWKVTDPLKFAQTLSGSIGNAESRIDTIVYNATKNTISNMTQDAVILSRDGKMTITEPQESDVVNNDLNLQEEKNVVVEIKSLTEEIMEQIGTSYEQYGIQILAVEVKKLDLPDDNKAAVYERMISERETIAAEYTARGQSQAQIIINETDRTVQIGLSDARAEAAVIVAEGEAEYMRILAEAYNTPEKQAFYAFVRALDAAKISMTDEDVLMIDEDSPLAQIFMGY